MRILILLILALLTAMALFYGLRLLWESFHPLRPDAPPRPDPLPPWLTKQMGHGLLLLAVLLMVGLALEDIFSTLKAPQEHQPPPPLTNTSTIPKNSKARFY